MARVCLFARREQEVFAHDGRLDGHLQLVVATRERCLCASENEDTGKSKGGGVVLAPFTAGISNWNMRNMLRSFSN